MLCRSRAQNGKLCLDCTGVGELHVRPSRGTAGRECFSSLLRDFPDCWQDSIFGGLGEHFDGILEPFGICFDTFLDKNGYRNNGKHKVIKKSRN